MMHDDQCGDAHSRADLVQWHDFHHHGKHVTDDKPLGERDYHTKSLRQIRKCNVECGLGVHAHETDHV